MKQILKIIKEHILIASLCFIFINILIGFILYLFDLRFRFYILVIIFLVSVLGLFLGIFQFAKRNINSKKVFNIIIIFSVFFLFFLVLPIISVTLCLEIGTEKVKVINNKKYVSLSKTSFYHYDLTYYNYVNPFFVSTKLKIYGDFNRINYNNFSDGILYFFDDNGNVLERAAIDFKLDNMNRVKEGKNFILLDEAVIGGNKADDYLLPEDLEILYEERFQHTILRFVLSGYALGQKMIVSVIKSVDDGKNFQFVTEDLIQVSMNAKFKFLNENVGFIVRNGKIDLSDSSGLYVTNDGGKTFSDAKFIYQPDKDIITDLYIEELPFYDNDELYIKCSIYDFNDNKVGYVTKYIWFKSEDNGKTWQVK